MGISSTEYSSIFLKPYAWMTSIVLIFCHHSKGLTTNIYSQGGFHLEIDLPYIYLFANEVWPLFISEYKTK